MRGSVAISGLNGFKSKPMKPQTKLALHACAPGGGTVEVDDVCGLS
jgi:hypothetical protein